MYLSKDLLLSIYKCLCKMHENPEMQGARQKVSAIKYFLALDEFYKQKQQPCNTTSRTDAADFVENVGHIVTVNSSQYTKDFYYPLAAGKDFDVGSNFYSAGVINDSKVNPNTPMSYPRRGGMPIMDVQGGVISLKPNHYITFEQVYLSQWDIALSLAIWLCRNDQYVVFSQTPLKHQVLNHIQSHYTTDAFNMFSNALSSANDTQFLSMLNIPNPLAPTKCVLSDSDIQGLFNIQTKVSPVAPAAPTVSISSSNTQSALVTQTQGRIRDGKNIILYGVPGVGKSWTVEIDYCSNEKQIERVVFHPDYTYSDFVGQILPKVKNGDVSYAFSPGPFTRILKKAIKDQNTPYFLIIEEINRGNAPAIFGDIFQLLDRAREDDSNKNIITGESVYGISNADIAKELFLSNKENASDDEIEAAEGHLIRIPGNLYIIGTMNTSDQNVFTLDTAFQRRWNMKMVRNEINAPEKHPILIKNIADTGISWMAFLSVINELILQVNSTMTSCEDKRLGVYFVHEEDLQDKKLWAEKVLKYLWDDAFRFNRDVVFNTEMHSLEEVIGHFDTTSGLSAFDFLKSEYKDLLNSKQNEIDSE